MTPREVLARRKCCPSRPDRATGCTLTHAVSCLATMPEYVAQADADITALHAAGFRIVPMEPTAAMILAGCYAVDAVPEIYRAMLTAAEKEDGT